MSTPPSSSSHLKAALDRFPKDRPLLLRLAIADETFRMICEDYGLARSRLSALSAATTLRDPAELSDYVRLVAELEAELAAFVTRAKSGGTEHGGR